MPAPNSPMSYAQAIPVLMYHHVSPNPGLVTVAPSTFEIQMAHLSHNGYTTLTADQLFEFLQGKEQMPRKSLVITFDDGYLDNYVYAFPILKRFGLHGIIFAITGWIGNGPTRNHAGQGNKLPSCPDHRSCKAAIASGNADDVMLRWSEIELMEASGAIEVHSHTHNHIRLDQQIPARDQCLATLASDLAQSRETLHTFLGKDSRHLCWPWGRFDSEYQAVAEKAGFVAQYSTSPHINSPTTDPRNIGRFAVKDRADSWLARRLWLYSHPWIGALYHSLKKPSSARTRHG